MPYVSQNTRIRCSLIKTTRRFQIFDSLKAKCVIYYMTYSFVTKNWTTQRNYISACTAHCFDAYYILIMHEEFIISCIPLTIWSEMKKEFIYSLTWLCSGKWTKDWLVKYFLRKYFSRKLSLSIFMQFSLMRIKMKMAMKTSKLKN